MRILHSHAKAREIFKAGLPKMGLTLTIKMGYRVLTASRYVKSPKRLWGDWLRTKQAKANEEGYLSIRERGKIPKPYLWPG
jgi:hypothetical protein